MIYIIFLVFFIFALYKSLTNVKLYFKSKKDHQRYVNVTTKELIPCLSWNPLFYYKLITWKKKPTVVEAMYDEFKDQAAKSSLFFVSAFGAPNIVVWDGSIIREILKDYRTFEKRFLARSVVSIHLSGYEQIVRVNGDVWKMHRSIMQPIFGNITTFFDVMQSKGEELVALWMKKFSDGAFTPIGEDISRVTLDVFGNTLLGKDFNFLNGQDVGPLNAYNFATKYLYVPFFSNIPMWYYKWAPFGLTKKVRESINYFEEFIFKIIDEYDDKSEKKSLLYLLIEANKDNKLSRQALRDSAIILFLGGHETTSTTLQYVIYNMAINQDCQEKLREEINRVFPNRVEVEGIKELKYMSNVINETLRLFPPSGIMGRFCTQDCQIGDFFIPKGTFLTLFNYGLQRDEKIWGKDAEKFNPDRFIECTKEQLDSFIPFGGGPRICIGNTFATFEEKVLLANIFKSFRISLEPDSKLIPTNNLFAPKSEYLKYRINTI